MDDEETADQVDAVVEEPKKKKRKHQVDPLDDSFHANGTAEVSEEPTKKKKKGKK